MKSTKSLLLLSGFIAVVVVAGSLIGINTAPGEWFAALAKPPFNPPSWLFAPVWFALYVMIAIAGWRTFLIAPHSSRMKIWLVQMVLNWAWSFVFFSFHQLWGGVVVILSLWALIIWFIRASWPADRTSALLFAPYMAWVSFASLLNIAIAVLN